MYILILGGEARIRLPQNFPKIDVLPFDWGPRRGVRLVGIRLKRKKPSLPEQLPEQRTIIFTVNACNKQLWNAGSSGTAGWSKIGRLGLYSSRTWYLLYKGFAVTPPSRWSQKNYVRIATRKNLVDCKGCRNMP